MVLNCASLNELSSEVCGRLWLLVMPRSASSWISRLPVIGLPLSADDFNWIARLRSIEATLLVVLNHADTLAPDSLPQVVKQLEERLARPVLPLSVGSVRQFIGRVLC